MISFSLTEDVPLRNNVDHEKGHAIAIPCWGIQYFEKQVVLMLVVSSSSNMPM